MFKDKVGRENIIRQIDIDGAPCNSSAKIEKHIADHFENMLNPPVDFSKTWDMDLDFF